MNGYDEFGSGALHLAHERQSRVWSAIARLVNSPYGLLLAFVSCSPPPSRAA
jgi:hypothetical protein